MKTLFMGQNQHGFKVVLYLEDVLAITFKDHRAEVQLIHSAGVDLSVESAARLEDLLVKSSKTVEFAKDIDPAWAYDLTAGTRVYNSITNEVETIESTSYLENSSKQIIRTKESQEGLYANVFSPV